jgi:hypothetical protein
MVMDMVRVSVVRRRREVIMASRTWGHLRVRVRVRVRW